MRTKKLLCCSEKTSCTIAHMEIKIEKVKEKEVAEFWSIFKEVLYESFPGYSPQVLQFFTDRVYTKTTYKYWLQSEAKNILCSKDTGKIVGFAVIDSPYGGVSLCRWLGVKKSSQRLGIGRKLFIAWEELAKNQGCHKIEVAGQPTAKGFYEKVGLTLEGERKSSYFGIDQFLFGKVIGIPNEQSMVKSSF